MLIPLLGVTWLVGLLSPLHIAFVYIFTILNSAQVSFLTLIRTIHRAASIFGKIVIITTVKRF